MTVITTIWEPGACRDHHLRVEYEYTSGVRAGRTISVSQRDGGFDDLDVEPETWIKKAWMIRGLKERPLSVKTLDRLRSELSLHYKLVAEAGGIL